MKLIQKIKAKSSKSNRVKGQLFTTLGAIASAILLTGVVVNPIGIVALTVLAVASGVKASGHAITTENDWDYILFCGVCHVRNNSNH